MPEVITDGYNEWEKCVRLDCDLEVVRPGKVQCSGDNDWIGCPYDVEELAVRFQKEVARIKKETIGDG